MNHFIKLVTCCCLIFGVFSNVSIFPDTLPKKLLLEKKGSFTIKVLLENPRYAREGVSAQLYIPPTISQHENSPLLVFFHGNSKNKNTFKKAGNFLHKSAATKKFMVLSVQNWWPLSGDQVSGVEDSREATNMLLNALAQEGLCNRNRIFVTGFSAGGLTALGTFLNSIDHWQNPQYREKFGASMESSVSESGKTSEDYYYSVMFPSKNMFFPYAGVISIKGNFYREFFMPDPMLSQEDRKSHYAILTQGKPVLLLVGGKKDAARVQKQIPEADTFFKEELGIQSEIMNFPKEGHSVSKGNLEALFRAMNL